MKIALVHDYLAQDGGAERVLKTMHELWPEAPIFVLFHDPKIIPYIDQKKIQESFLGRMPFIKSHYPWYLPLMPLATEKMRLDGFDVVLSSTSSFAKGVLTGTDTTHISYCHTPARYLWSNTHDYVTELPYNALVKFILPRMLSKMRLWDTLSVDRVDHFIANSRTVERRIQKYYRRESTVINPPVEVDNFSQATTLGDYFVAGGRLVPYKNFDIIIKVFNRLRWPLKIFGIGPDYERLKAMARPNIEFLGRITDFEKADLLAKAKAFIHPQVEDFGITPVEAMATGRPVIALNQGGATETVLAGTTGLFFERPTWESLFDAVINFETTNWRPDVIQAHAQNYHPMHFKRDLERFVNDRFEEFKAGLKQEALVTK